LAAVGCKIIVFKHGDEKGLIGNCDGTEAWRRWKTGEKGQIEGSIQEIVREFRGEFAGQLLVP
jgi:hypothetical protein